MTPLARGCVVACGHRIGLVWADRGTVLDVLPILVPIRPWINDVLLELPELVACGGPRAHSVVRVGLLTRVPAKGQQVMGTAPGPLICRVVQAVIREAAHAATLERWSGDRAHRRNADTRPVNLVGTT